ncbi:class I SAM-dependent methyltransferase [Thiomicrospira sp. S5]|uniref:class I SAM-dependent methyltransferase n=1 Tax=Thiomicrospira sp. S5 TaxID=1803865 RepID=UPI001F47664A|nr:class I SAM-dependent methyltransferase [Thiomicrospira sp. S5]
MMTNPSFQSFLHRFYQTSKGQSLFRQEKPLIDHALAHVFGLYLVQLGRVSSESLLDNSRVNCKVLLDDKPVMKTDGLYVQADMDYLPIRNDAVDAFVLPHTLESVTDPYHLLRQVDSALLAEGHVLITGFNPLGCRTMRNRFGEHRRHFKAANLIRAHRVVDWLSVLGYDIEQVTYSSISCLTRHDSERGTWGWVETMEKTLGRMGLDFGNVYCILAKKRIASPTPVGLNWRLSNWLIAAKGRQAVVSNRASRHQRMDKDS